MTTPQERRTFSTWRDRLKFSTLVTALLVFLIALGWGLVYLIRHAGWQCLVFGVACIAFSAFLFEIVWQVRKQGH